MTNHEPTIFTKILNGIIPSTQLKEFEDDDFFVIKDINPQAPVHVLLITKKPFLDLNHAPTAIQSQILVKAREIAQVLCPKGYQIKINVGPPKQEVPHLHLHILGGW